MPPSSSSRKRSSSSVVAAAPKTKKEKWTDDEDNILIAYVKKNEAKNWDEVAKNSGLSKTGNSCYLRWEHHLKPGKNEEPFTEEEDAKIIHFQNEWGNKWAKIALELLPGRNRNEVKNRWNTYLSKKNAESINPQHGDQVLQVDDEEPIEFSDIYTEEGFAKIIEYLNNKPFA